MELLNTKTYLKTTRLKLLENWSVRYLLESKFSYNDSFELMPIGSFLIKSRLKILIEDDIVYQRVTVKINNNGVVPRDTEIGKNIGTKQQYIVKAGQFLMSKIDARNGAFGLVPENLDGAIVTNDFPVFDVDSSVINPEFLVLITTTKEFINFAQSCSSGTTNRQRIDIDMFLNVNIPLPSLTEQNRIVEAYNAKIKLAEEQELKATELEKEIEEYLFSSLAIKKQAFKTRNNRFSIINYHDITIWAVWNVNDAYKSKIYENVNLGTILKMSSGKFLPAKSQIQGDFYVYGGNGITGTHNKWVHQGKRIIIGRVGEKCGNVHLVSGQYWVTDNAFLTEKIDNDFLDEYLAIVLNLLNLNRFRVISAQPSLSQQNLINVPVPKPTIEIQKSIIEFVSKIELKIEQLKLSSKQNKNKAQIEFETVIFAS